MSIEENQARIYEILLWLNKNLIRRNIDCFLTGDLVCFLATQTPFKENIYDIEILINEKDIKKLKRILSDSSFMLEDLRYDSPKYFDKNLKMPVGVDELVAKSKNSDFKIVFTSFRRGLNEEFVTREYFKNNGNTKIYETILSKKQMNIKYDSVIRRFNDIYIKTISLESIYNSKINSDNELDKYICSLLKEKGNMDSVRLNLTKQVEQEKTTRIINPIDIMIEKISLEDYEYDDDLTQEKNKLRNILEKESNIKNYYENTILEFLKKTISNIINKYESYLDEDKLQKLNEINNLNIIDLELDFNNIDEVVENIIYKKILIIDMVFNSIIDITEEEDFNWIKDGVRHSETCRAGYILNDGMIDILASDYCKEFDVFYLNNSNKNVYNFCKYIEDKIGPNNLIETLFSKKYIEILNECLQEDSIYVYKFNEVKKYLSDNDILFYEDIIFDTIYEERLKI